ncbi:unnamed protein product [Closterium sp. Naga37s-1]|nr:unnamed protein product [Closterium sp. Naga37s-1]
MLSPSTNPSTAAGVSAPPLPPVASLASVLSSSACPFSPTADPTVGTSMSFPTLATVESGSTTPAAATPTTSTCGGVSALNMRVEMLQRLLSPPSRDSMRAQTLVHAAASASGATSAFDVSPVAAAGIRGCPVAAKEEGLPSLPACVAMLAALGAGVLLNAPVAPAVSTAAAPAAPALAPAAHSLATPVFPAAPPAAAPSEAPPAQAAAMLGSYSTLPLPPPSRGIIPGTSLSEPVTPQNRNASLHSATTGASTGAVSRKRSWQQAVMPIQSHQAAHTITLEDGKLTALLLEMEEEERRAWEAPWVQRPEQVRPLLPGFTSPQQVQDELQAVLDAVPNIPQISPANRVHVPAQQQPAQRVHVPAQQPPMHASLDFLLQQLEETQEYEMMLLAQAMEAQRKEGKRVFALHPPAGSNAEVAKDLLTRYGAAYLGTSIVLTHPAPPTLPQHPSPPSLPFPPPSLKAGSNAEVAKDLLTRYGGAYLGTSIALSLVSFSLCYLLVDQGVDVAGLLDSFGLHVDSTGEAVGTSATACAARKAPFGSACGQHRGGGGYLSIAYAAHKTLSPHGRGSGHLRHCLCSPQGPLSRPFPPHRRSHSCGGRLAWKEQGGGGEQGGVREETGRRERNSEGSRRSLLCVPHCRLTPVVAVWPGKSKEEWV